MAVLARAGAEQRRQRDFYLCRVVRHLNALKNASAEESSPFQSFSKRETRKAKKMTKFTTYLHHHLGGLLLKRNPFSLYFFGTRGRGQKMRVKWSEAGESLSLDTSNGDERMSIPQEPQCSKMDVSGKKEQRQEIERASLQVGVVKKEWHSGAVWSADSFRYIGAFEN